MMNVKKILVGSLFLLIIIFVGLLFFGSKIINKGKNQEANNLVDANKSLLTDPSISMVDDLRGIDKNDYVVGADGAKVDIIVYEDLSDPYSINLNETLKEVSANFSSDVRIAYRPYVNKSFSLSWPTYSFVECAGEQEKFFQARDLVLEKLSKNELIEDDFIKYSVDLGLNSDKLNTCWSGDKYLDKIEGLSKEAEGFGVYGSPVVFVNKQIIIGARAFEDVINGGGEKLMGLKNIINLHLGRDIDKDIDQANLDESSNGGDGDEEDVAFCTMDAKECSNGSFVGRDGKNNCEFFPCPGE